MKMFIPPINQMIQLTKDWTINISDYSRSWEMRDLNPTPTGYGGSTFNFTFPAGTVLKFMRYGIRGQGSHRQPRIGLRTMFSPDNRLSSKKLGGRSAGGSRRFTATLDQVNEIEYEVVS